MVLQDTDDVQEVLDLSCCEYLPWHLLPYSWREAEALLWSSITGCTSAQGCSDTQTPASGTPTDNTGLLSPSLKRQVVVDCCALTRPAANTKSPPQQSSEVPSLLPSSAVRWILVLKILPLCKRACKVPFREESSYTQYRSKCRNTSPGEAENTAYVW